MSLDSVQQPGIIPTITSVPSGTDEAQSRTHGRFEDLLAKIEEHEAQIANLEASRLSVQAELSKRMDATTTKEELIYLAGSTDGDVRLQVVRHPNAPFSVLVQLYNTDPRTRLLAAHAVHKKIGASDLTGLDPKGIVAMLQDQP
jgi:hypothetical protein